MDKDKIAQVEKPAEKPQPEPAVTPKETKYPIERLRRECRALFDVSETVFMGATLGMAGEHTVSEVQSKIEAWQKGRAVKKEDR